MVNIITKTPLYLKTQDLLSDYLLANLVLGRHPILKGYKRKNNKEKWKKG